MRGGGVFVVLVMVIGVEVEEVMVVVTVMKRVMVVAVVGVEVDEVGDMVVLGVTFVEGVIFTAAEWQVRLEGFLVRDHIEGE